MEIGSWRSAASYAIDALGMNESPETLVNRAQVTDPRDTVIIHVTANAVSPEGVRDLVEARSRGMIRVIQETEPGATREEATVNVVSGDSARLPTSPVSG